MEKNYAKLYLHPSIGNMEQILQTVAITKQRSAILTAT